MLNYVRFHEVANYNGMAAVPMIFGPILLHVKPVTVPAFFERRCRVHYDINESCGQQK